MPSEQSGKRGDVVEQVPHLGPELDVASASLFDETLALGGADDLHGLEDDLFQRTHLGHIRTPRSSRLTCLEFERETRT